MKRQYITKQDFLSYFRYPQPFWFLITEEIESFFNEETSEVDLEELLQEDHIKLLIQLVESPDSLIGENNIKLNKVKDQKLIEKFKEIFKVPNLGFYNYVSVKEDRTKDIVEILVNETIPTALIYKPTLSYKHLQIKPTCIFKKNKKIYVIEHFWSTTLKKENLAHFIFYNHFFTKYLKLEISQYLISYLDSEPSPNKELLLKFTNSLPFTSKVRKPEGHDDPKMKNINTLFFLNTEYDKDIYSLFVEESVYQDINNDLWEIDDEELNDPEIAIKALIEHRKEPVKDISFEDLSLLFLDNKQNIVSPSSAHFKRFFQNYLPNFTYSSNVLPLVKSLEVLNSFINKVSRENFVDYTSKLLFIEDFPKDQDYIIFPVAIDRFQDLKTKKIKVYYDFETVCLPYPYIENTKPYTQIVLQMSLIKTIDDKEEPTNNLIIDPLDLTIENFKEIIDGIYVDDIDVAYIVYNKSFENTRLKEMAELINEDGYREKVVEIIDRTIDLANWFAYGNNPHIIHKKLQGFHSIKKVNKLIPREIEKATGTKKYSDLVKCQNGVIAQAMLLSRALVTDKEEDENNWEKNKKFMYDYCENDVRSMIAVEKYIEVLINKNKYDAYKTDKFLSRKMDFKRMKKFLFR